MVRRGALALAALLPGCSLGDVGNALTPRGGYTLTPDITYGPLPRHRYDLYETGARGPLVVFIHGGEWREGDKNLYRFVGQAFCSRGIDCAIPNYRLYPEVRFPSFVEDAALALRHIDRPMVLCGHSSGAHVTMLLALDPTWRAPPLAGAIGLAGPYDFLPLDNPLHERILSNPAGLAATQPINFVRNFQAGGDGPPLLLMTGDADTTVRPRNTVALAAARRAAGGSVTEVHYPGMAHVGIIAALSVLLRPFRPPVLDEMAGFVRQVWA